MRLYYAAALLAIILALLLIAAMGVAELKNGARRASTDSALRSLANVLLSGDDETMRAIERASRSDDPTELPRALVDLHPNRIDAQVRSGMPLDAWENPLAAHIEPHPDGWKVRLRAAGPERERTADDLELAIFVQGRRAVPANDRGGDSEGEPIILSFSVMRDDDGNLTPAVGGTPPWLVAYAPPGEREGTVIAWFSRSWDDPSPEAAVGRVRVERIDRHHYEITTDFHEPAFFTGGSHEPDVSMRLADGREVARESRIPLPAGRHVFRIQVVEEADG